jgi:hypothetical protein
MRLSSPKHITPLLRTERRRLVLEMEHLSQKVKSKT